MDQSPGGYLYAISMEGELHHNRNGGWEVINIDCVCPTNIWAYSDDELFVTGFGGELVRVKGGTIDTLDNSRCLMDVHGSSASNVLAVGGMALTLNVSNPPSERLTGLASYNGEVYVCAGEIRMVYVLKDNKPEQFKQASLYNLYPVGDHLFGVGMGKEYGTALLAQFDGKNWTGQNMDLRPYCGIKPTDGLCT